MAIEFNCSHCDKLLKTPDDKAGRGAKCPGCGEMITVPAGEQDTFGDAFEEQPVAGGGCKCGRWDEVVSGLRRGNQGGGRPLQTLR
ncbi:MAG: hypothetical protein CMJ48_13030 [Planctomycetaceae bacterium]|nr:hypothetical protein [Planctomycetaceae bacterium]